MKHISREAILSCIEHEVDQGALSACRFLGSTRKLIQHVWSGTQESTGLTRFPGDSAAGGLVPTQGEIELPSWEASVEVKINRETLVCCPLFSRS